MESSYPGSTFLPDYYAAWTQGIQPVEWKENRLKKQSRKKLHLSQYSLKTSCWMLQDEAALVVPSSQGGFLGGILVKNPPANAGNARDAGSIPGSGRSPGVGNGNPLQYSCLKSSLDGGACWATVHGGAKRRTWLSTHTGTAHTKSQALRKSLKKVMQKKSRGQSEDSFTLCKVLTFSHFSSSTSLKWQPIEAAAQLLCPRSKAQWNKITQSHLTFLTWEMNYLTMQKAKPRSSLRKICLYFVVSISKYKRVIKDSIIIL